MKKIFGLVITILICFGGVCAQDYDFAVPVSNGEVLYSSSVPAGSVFDYFEQDSSTDAAMYYEPSTDYAHQVNVFIVAIPKRKKPPVFNGWTGTRLNCFNFDGTMFDGTPYNGVVCGYYYLLT